MCSTAAGRRPFAQRAADRGASVAGVDAAQELIEIAAERASEGDFRVGDIEALPWKDDTFDVITGLSSFQFAHDKVRAFAERACITARGGDRDPHPCARIGRQIVLQPVFPFFPAEALDCMKQSGIFALSGPGKLEDVLSAARRTADQDDEIDCQVMFEDAEAAVRAFIGAGPTELAIRHSGEPRVAEGVARRPRRSPTAAAASCFPPGIAP